MKKIDNKNILSELKQKPYLEHWLRINRIYEFICLIESNKIKNKHVQRYKFDLYLSFFVLCYHFRDWLVNSKFIKPNIADAFIQNSYEIGLCRNLCLGVKHYEILKPSSPQMANFGFARIPIVREYNPFMASRERVKILADGKNHDALKLASSCLKFWKDFLDKNNLL